MFLIQFHLHFGCSFSKWWIWPTQNEIKKTRVLGSGGTAYTRWGTRVTSLVAVLRRVAGGVAKVSLLHPSARLIILLTWSLLFNHLPVSLTWLPSLALAVVAVCTVCLLLCTLMATWRTSSTKCTLALSILYYTLSTHLSVPFAGVRLACLLHTDIPDIHLCQRQKSREQVALFLTLLTTTLRSFSCLLHVNWTIIGWLVFDCLRN